MRGSYISESELGLCNPRLSVLVQIARALGEPVTALVEGAEGPEIAPRRTLGPSTAKGTG
jgi:transcriptional regulator with XRE-family HTH domain